MAQVTGLTAARMQQIIDRQVASGAVDLSGNLIFTRENGSTFNAGSVKGNKGDPATYPISGFPSGASSTYVRLGTLDGLNATTGASMQFQLGGIGNLTTTRRGTILVHAAQRGDNGIDVKAWSWGLDLANAGLFKIFTRAMGSFLYEIWGQFSPYTPAPTYVDMSRWQGLINLDSLTTTAPSNLVEWPIERSEIPVVQYATDVEIMDGTATDKSITPKALRDAGGGDPPGVIHAYAGATAPSGFLLCQGQAVLRATYQRLFNVISTQYGAGNGTTTFNLPNLRGKVIVGVNTLETEFNVLGEIGGEKTVALTINQMPSHNHGGATNSAFGYNDTNVYASGGSTNFVAHSWNGALVGSDGTFQARFNHVHGITAQGGSQAHNNLQPYMALNYIIKI